MGTVEVTTDEPGELQDRVRVWGDIEAIRKLKARYWLSIDKKQRNRSGCCFTEDAMTDVPPWTHRVGKNDTGDALSNGDKAGQSIVSLISRTIVEC